MSQSKEQLARSFNLSRKTFNRVLIDRGIERLIPDYRRRKVLHPHEIAQAKGLYEGTIGGEVEKSTAG